MQREKECFICGNAIPFGYVNGLEEHHIFGGPNRKNSERRGLKVWLCGESCHRTGKEAVHMNRKVDLCLKVAGQKVYERRYGSREEFIAEFGKSYL